MQNQGFRPFASEAVSGAFWERFFANLDSQIGPKSTPGAVLGPQGRVLGRPGGVMDRLGGLLDGLGAGVELSWALLGPSWGRRGRPKPLQDKPVLACEREAR